jgi:hypothetical protein
MTQTPAPRAVAFARVRLALTIALAVLVASVWAARVPFFQQPDEMAHADYAFELADVGRPFAVPHAVVGQTVTAQTRYLSRATHFRENRYATYVRMPHDYGSRDFFRALDRAVPPPNRTPPPPGAVLPYAMFSYPAGYYVIAALAMRFAALVHPGSLSAQFFFARSIGVLCLIGTLLLGYDIFRRLHLSRTTATVATFAAGLLPLTSWVSGYLQPDVLTTLLLTASIAASLRWKRTPEGLAAPTALALSLVLLAMVKEHYAIAAIAATTLAAVCDRATIRRPWLLAATFLVPLCAVYVATHVSPAGSAVPPKLSVFRASGSSLTQRLADFGAFVVLGLRDVFAGGDAFSDYWFRFGYHPIDSIFPGPFARLARASLVAASLATLALFVARERFVLGRLVAVARKRSPVAALRLFAGDPVLNVYAFVTLILLSVYAYSNGFVWLEGRYWLPVLIPTIAIVTVRNVRIFKRPVLRRRVGLVFAAAWAAYASIGAPLGLAAIQRSFYTSPRPSAHEPYADILSVVPDRACAIAANAATLRVRGGCVLRVTGFAIDGTRGLPATDVFLLVDGVRRGRARVGLPSPRVVYTYNDRALARSGFDARLPTAALTPGRHDIGIAIVEDGAPLGRSAPQTIAIDVVR